MQDEMTIPATETNKVITTDRIVAQTIGVYRGGYVLSFVLVGIGLVVALFGDSELSTELGGPGTIAEHLVDLNPNGFIGLGIGVMILSPIVMSIEVALNFFRAQDRRFALITSAVAAILVVTMALAFV
jgi:uncharacterized membrane protein